MKTALFVANPNVRVNQQIALGLAEELQKHGSWFVHLQPDVATLQELRTLLRMTKPAALVMHSARFSPPMTRFVGNLPIPRVCVAVDWQPALPAPVVIPDDEAIGLMAAKYLLGLGFDHFATLNYKSALPPLRIEAFSRQIKRAGKTCGSTVLPSAETVDHPFHAAEGEGQLVHWLRRMPKPCAIFAHGDNMGAQLVQLCSRHGVRVPEDVAVLGVDDDPLFCRTVSPNMASIHVPNARMGMEAARLILDWRPGRRVLKIPPTGVMERGSVRMLVASDPLVSSAIDHLRAHVGETVRVRDLQRVTGLSPQMLVYRFKATIHRTPMEEILRHRINHAKFLLGETDEQVGAIARQCGFKSANRFYLTFRNLTGMAPLDYRCQFSA